MSPDHGVAGPRLTHVGTYHRTIGASVERIWENALDWEHLPWLHRSSFVAIDLLEGDAERWRARVTLGGVLAHHVVIELRTQRDRLSYVTRTLEGSGAGTEIRTQLEPATERTTRIRIEFHVAGLARLLGPVAGIAYRRLYERLWSEDETMMQRRQAVLDAAAARRSEGDAAAGPPPAVPLGPRAALLRRLPLVVETRKGPVRVLMTGANELLAHRTTCPHLGGPLEESAIVDGAITCPWHGYRFDVRSGAPVGAHRCHLGRPPCVDVDSTTDEVSLAWR